MNYEHLYHWLLKRNIIISNLHTTEDESSGTKYFSNYVTSPQQIKPAQYTVYSVSTDIMLSCGVLCFFHICIASQVSPLYTIKGIRIYKVLHTGATWDARQIIMINDIKAVIIHLSSSLDLVFVSTSLYTIMPVPPILMAPRGPSSPTLISCSLWKK